MPNPTSEKQFEKSVERYIHRRFVRDVINPPRNSMQWFTVNTAGLSQPDSVWSAPDLLLVCVSSSALQPAPTLELIGFELKLSSNFGKPSIMQATAQHKYAHRVYVTVCCDEDPTNDDAFRDATRLATDQGVGLICTTNADDPTSYRCVAESRRQKPEWDRLERLLRHSIGQSQLERLRCWLAQSYNGHSP